jgi:CheY-like chemotaxis protein
MAVDDSPSDLSLLNMMLWSAGYSFVPVASGADCLSLIHRCPPRMILLDIQMPGLDGIETCRRLREIPELRTTPIAFLTACKVREDVRAGMTAGGNDFIGKPFDKDVIIRRVAHWTSHRIGQDARPV